MATRLIRSFPTGSLTRDPAHGCAPFPPCRDWSLAAATALPAVRRYRPRWPGPVPRLRRRAAAQPFVLCALCAAAGATGPVVRPLPAPSAAVAGGVVAASLRLAAGPAGVALQVLARAGGRPLAGRSVAAGGAADRA